jgi:peptidoglycan hydrolase-like protein with peptidoglycan-binding domain
MRHIDRGYPLVRSEEFDMPPARGRDLLLRGDLAALPRIEPRRPPTKQPPRAPTPASPPTTRSPADPPAPAPSPPSAPPAFDPAHGLWGLWPLNTHKPMIRRGARGDAVRYLQGVIAHEAGGNIAVDGVFEMQTWYRVQQVQAFFGILADGRVGDQTWPIIDQLAGG